MSGITVGLRAALQKGGYYGLTEQTKQQHCCKAAHSSRAKAHHKGAAHTVGAVGAKVVTYDWLRRLRHRVVHNKHYREQIADDAERRNAVFAQIFEKHIVASNHHCGYCKLAHKPRKADTQHIASVAQRQSQA